MQILLAFSIIVFSMFFKSIDGYFIFMLFVSMATFTLVKLENTSADSSVEGWKTYHYFVMVLIIYFLSKITWLMQKPGANLFDILNQTVTIQFYL
jgi:hypothetical protein